MVWVQGLGFRVGGGEVISRGQYRHFSTQGQQQVGMLAPVV